MTHELKVDPEFQALIPLPPPEDRELLVSALKSDGCLDSIKTWNGVIVDGHNRFEICQDNGIEFKVTEMEFGSRTEAKIWILCNQLGRRNLNDDQRTFVALDLQKLVAKQAKQDRSRKAVNAREQKAGRALILTDTASGKIDIESESETSVDCVPLDSAHKSKSLRKKKDTLAMVSKQSRLPERKLRDAALVDKSRPDLAEKVRSGEMNLKAAKRAVNQDEKTKKKCAAAAEAAKIVVGDDQGVKDGDFREVAKTIEDNSVDLIFTDPPYDRDSLPMYGDLAQVAQRVLKPGGSMICYLGQYQINEVCALVAPHLRLWWTLACIHTGKFARMNEYGIVVKWKPLLWFVKGTRGDKETFIDDSIVSEMEKDSHPWQQGITEARYCIDKLTLPGAMVFDPFCGGGTTACAAKELKRRWITCDIDKASAMIARRRIHDHGVDAAMGRIQPDVGQLSLYPSPKLTNSAVPRKAA